MPSVRMLALQAQLDEAVEDEVRRVTLNIRNTLVDEPPDGTPIDTGFASNNWWFNVGGPAGSPSSPTAGGSSRIAADTLSIATATINGQPLHITNNASYIGLLNDGSSQQSPAGFVDRAVVREQFASRYRRLG